MFEVIVQLETKLDQILLYILVCYIIRTRHFLEWEALRVKMTQPLKIANNEAKKLKLVPKVSNHENVVKNSCDQIFVDVIILGKMQNLLFDFKMLLF